MTNAAAMIPATCPTVSSGIRETSEDMVGDGFRRRVVAAVLNSETPSSPHLLYLFDSEKPSTPPWVESPSLAGNCTRPICSLQSQRLMPLSGVDNIAKP